MLLNKNVLAAFQFYYMKKIILSLFVTLLMFNVGVAAINSTEGGEDKNDKKDKKSSKSAKSQPDVPGALVIEVANNILSNAPDNMKLNQWASWTVNIYYMYEMNFGESAFSFNPGFGLGLEHFRFNENYTLTNTNDDFNTVVTPLRVALPNADVYRRSSWGQYFLDVPFEFRWYAKKEFKRKSFKIAVGGKVGFRFDSKTKVVYDEFDSKKKKLKNKQNFNFISPRYGVYGRVGFGAISLYYYYSLTEVFKNKRGPNETRAQNMMVGISISGF